MGRWGGVPSIKEAAREELEVIRKAEDARIRAEGLPDILDYVPFLASKLGRNYSAPRHLEPMAAHIRHYETKPFNLVFSVPPRHGKPLEGNTLVRMADGTHRPIRTLREGDRVVSGTGRPTTVVAVYAQGELPVWEVRTASGARFLAEGSHRFLTGRGWQRVDELRARARREDVLVRAKGLELDPAGRPVGVVTDFRPWGTRLPVGTWCPDKVVSARPSGAAACYCITVSEDESFLVTGADLVTHNTETLLHVVPWVLRKHPDWRIIYCTYSMALARDKANDVRRLCQVAGVRMATNNVTDWRTPEGGGFTATGIGGMLTGKGANILIVDDPTKDRATAESRVYRDKIWDWFNSTAYTRRLLPYASVIVCGTRWHVDDLQGRLIRGDPSTGRKPWACVNLPAIADDYEEALRLGREPESALWPGANGELYTRERLLEIKAQLGPYEWASLYQGRPQPRGGTIFKDPYFYDELPGGSHRIAVGLDMACSDDTKRDHSVAVVGYYYPELDTICVVRVLRKQMEAPVWKEYVHNELFELVKEGAAGWRFYGAGTEITGAQFSRQLPHALPVRLIPASTSKFIRAQPYAAAWNARKVLLPAPYTKSVDASDDGAWAENPGYDTSWVSPFYKEHMEFTGNKSGETDDQVDAGAAMHDELRPPKYQEATGRGQGPISQQRRGR